MKHTISIVTPAQWMLQVFQTNKTFFFPYSAILKRDPNTNTWRQRMKYWNLSEMNHLKRAIQMTSSPLRNYSERLWLKFWRKRFRTLITSRKDVENSQINWLVTRSSESTLSSQHEPTTPPNTSSSWVSAASPTQTSWCQTTSNVYELQQQQQRWALAPGACGTQQLTTSYQQSSTTLHCSLLRWSSLFASRRLYETPSDVTSRFKPASR